MSMNTSENTYRFHQSKKLIYHVTPLVWWSRQSRHSLRFLHTCIVQKRTTIPLIWNKSWQLINRLHYTIGLKVHNKEGKVSLYTQLVEWRCYNVRRNIHMTLYKCTYWDDFYYKKGYLIMNSHDQQEKFSNRKETCHVCWGWSYKHHQKSSKELRRKKPHKGGHQETKKHLFNPDTVCLSQWHRHARFKIYRMQWRHMFPCLQSVWLQ